MATLTSETTFSVGAALDTYTEAVDLVLYPQNAGTGAMRELHYPGDVYPPIIYEDLPDKTINFDSTPWTARPLVAAGLTLEDAQIATWLGYQKDRPVSEHWLGSDLVSRMTGYFLRRLFEYYANPPATDYITWYPKDRTAQGYKIIIESVTVGGEDLVSFHTLAMAVAEVMTWEVVIKFRIIDLGVT